MQFDQITSEDLHSFPSVCLSTTTAIYRMRVTKERPLGHEREPIQRVFLFYSCLITLELQDLFVRETRKEISSRYFLRFVSLLPFSNSTTDETAEKIPSILVIKHSGNHFHCLPSLLLRKSIGQVEVKKERKKEKLVTTVRTPSSFFIQYRFTTKTSDNLSREMVSRTTKLKLPLFPFQRSMNTFVLV